MIFTKTAIKDAYIVDIEPIGDERGAFARTFCAEAFAAAGLAAEFPQCSTSFNRRRGTLRGLHFQRAPHEEAKLMRCTAGRVFDVIADLRRDSPSFGQWVGVELDAQSQRMVFAPAGCAHGFQTLDDGAELFYQISTPHAPHAAQGIRWDDPALGIDWPLADPILSLRDAALPLLETVA